VALLRASKALDKIKSGDADEKTGIDIIAGPSRRRSSRSPELRRRGGDRGGQGPGSKDVNFGFNADTLEYGDLIKGGVIDRRRSSAARSRTRRASVPCS